MLYYHNWAASLNPQFFLTVKGVLERSLKQNSRHAMLKSMLSDLFGMHYQWGLEFIDDDLELSLKLANEALDLDNRCRYAHWAKAYNCFLRRDREGFMEFSQYAMQLNPHDTNILTVIGLHTVLAGETDRGMVIINTALHLNPYIPCWYHIAPSVVHYLAGNYEYALNRAKCITHSVNLWGYVLRTAAYGQLGKLTEAEKEVMQTLNLYPTFREKLSTILPRFFYQAETVDKIMEGLKRGGLVL